MRRRFWEGEGGDSSGCPGEPTEPERAAQQSQVLTQEMEIVLNPCALSQQYPSAIAGSSWGSALGDRLGNGGARANLRRRSHFGARRRRRRECNLHPR